MQPARRAPGRSPMRRLLDPVESRREVSNRHCRPGYRVPASEFPRHRGQQSDHRWSRSPPDAYGRVRSSNRLAYGPPPTQIRILSSPYVQGARKQGQTGKTTFIPTLRSTRRNTDTWPVRSARTNVCVPPGPNNKGYRGLLAISMHFRLGIEQTKVSLELKSFSRFATKTNFV